VYKFNLPNDLNKFFEVLEYFEYKPIVIGSFADYFLLKQDKKTIKDLDILVNDYNELNCDLSGFLDVKSKLYEKVLFGRVINDYTVEVYKDSTFDYNMNSFKLNDYDFKICTPQYRLNYLKNIQNNIVAYNKDLNKITNLVKEYTKRYSLD
jgi:hypothetical protein